MPTKNEGNCKIYYYVEGETKPVEIGEAASIELEDMNCDMENVINNPEYFKGGEITLKMSQKEHKKFKRLIQRYCPIYFTNNWRKRHNLPMVRQRRDRK